MDFQKEGRGWDKGDKTMDRLDIHIVGMHQVDTSLGENIFLGSLHHCRWPVGKKRKALLDAALSKGSFCMKEKT